MKQKTAKTIAIILAIAMIITSFSFVVFLPSVFGATEEAAAKERIDILEEYIKYIKENYVTEVTYDTLINGAFDGVTKALNDTYSVYYSDVKKAQEFKASVDGTFYGIGVEVKKHDKGLLVVKAIYNSPAYLAGVKDEDIIIKVDGKDISKDSLESAVALLRGEKGTSVAVTVLRGKEEKNFTIVRDKINESSVAATVIDDTIGYIHVTSFDSDTEKEFSQAMSELKSQAIKSLIVDLRYNPGGYTDKAEKIADQLLENCYITHYESQGKIISSVRANNGKKEDLPLVVIVNGDTASSAELLASALGENGAALVGTTTFGKGVAQALITIADGREAKLTHYYFLSPKKNNYHEKGITPEVYVKNYAAEGEKLDELQQQYNSFVPVSEKIKYGPGKTGLNVYGAQQRLSLLGYDVEVNGTVDEKTYNAIKKFQADTGLYSYGTLDLTTAQKIDEMAYRFVTGYFEKDLQLEKAIEIIKTK